MNLQTQHPKELETHLSVVFRPSYFGVSIQQLKTEAADLVKFGMKSGLIHRARRCQEAEPPAGKRQKFS